MTDKKFPIPKLNKEKWTGLQNSLHLIRNSAFAIEKLLSGEGSNKKVLEELTANDRIILGYIENISVNLGIIDHILGREYTVEEAIEKLRSKFLEGKN